MKFKMILTVALGMSALAMADHKAWGVKELEQAGHETTEAFKKKFGAELYENVQGFGIQKNSQGIAGKGTVVYTEDGEKKTASFFCHYHEEDEIDCH